jgi:hypothetical protein
VDQRGPLWVWWKPAWRTVYDNLDSNDTVWIYGVADRESYSPIALKDYSGLTQGDRILLRGRWEEHGRGERYFAEETIYRLEAGRYAPFYGVPDPTGRPTVTPITP